MKTGIVMEISKHKAVIMRSDGHFITVPAEKGWRVGDIVSLKPQKKNYNWLILAASFFLLFIPVSLFGYNIYFNQTSLVSIDVNPSMELLVNRFDKVVDVSPLSPEAKKILKEIDLKNKKLDDAIALLFQQGLQPYVSQDSYITFTVHSDNKKTQDALIEQLQNIAKLALSYYSTAVQIETYAVDEETVEAAHSHHVSAGKYTTIQELQEVLPEASVEEYAHCSIREIKDEIERHGTHHESGSSQSENSATLKEDQTHHSEPQHTELQENLNEEPQTDDQSTDSVAPDDQTSEESSRHNKHRNKHHN